MESDKMCDSGEVNYPLDDVEVYWASCIASLFVDKASSMSPRVMRSASALILALRRMPLATPGIDMRIGFRTADRDGNWSWVDVEISEYEFRLSLGHHHYDPSVGGDTDSSVIFEAAAGSDRSFGSIDDWLDMASSIAEEGYPSLENDDSDYGALDGYFDDDESG